MMEHAGPPEHPWRQPLPWATHQDLHPLHREIGSLQSDARGLRGELSQLQAQLGSLRAEILTGNDRLAKLIVQQQEQEPEPRSNGVSLTLPVLAVIIAAAVLAGAILAPLLGRLDMVGS